MNRYCVSTEGERAHEFVRRWVERRPDAYSIFRFTDSRDRSRLTKTEVDYLLRIIHSSWLPTLQIEEV